MTRFSSRAAVLFFALTTIPLLAQSPAPEPKVIKERKIVRVAPGARVLMLGEGFRRGFLGVGLINLNEQLREHFGQKDAGVLVSSVAPDSPAAKAGIKVGDVITAIDGSRVASSVAVSRALRDKKEGDAVRISVLRDRERKELVATVVEREDQFLDIGPVMDAARIEARTALDDPEIQKAMTEVRDYFNSPEWKAQVEKLHECTVNQDKLRELESRLRDLERELKRK